MPLKRKLGLRPGVGVSSHSQLERWRVKGVDDVEHNLLDTGVKLDYGCYDAVAHVLDFAAYHCGNSSCHNSEILM